MSARPRPPRLWTNVTATVPLKTPLPVAVAAAATVACTLTVSLNCPVGFGETGTSATVVVVPALSTVRSPEPLLERYAVVADWTDFEGRAHR